MPLRGGADEKRGAVAFLVWMLVKVAVDLACMHLHLARGVVALLDAPGRGAVGVGLQHKAAGLHAGKRLVAGWHHAGKRL